VLAAAGLLVTRFLLGRLGQHDYGLWLVATQLLGYLMLTDLGIVALLPREVAYATGREANQTKGEPLAEVVGHTVRIVLWQMPLVAAVAGGLWLFLPSEWHPLRGPLGVVILAFVLTFPLRIPSQVLRGLQDLAVLGGIQTGALLAGTATTVMLVIAGFGLYALAFGWVASQVLMGAVAIWRIKQRFPGALPSSIPQLTAEAARHRFSRGLWVSFSQVAVVLLNGTDVLIIGKVLGAAAVVPYMCTGKLIGFLANQPQMLLQAAEPGLAEMKTGGTRDGLLRVSTALTRGMLIASGAIVCGVMVVNYGFVRVWVGESQWGGITLTALILLRALLGHWELTSSAAIFAFGYERRLAWVALINGLTTIAISIPLVRWLGLTGAPIGSLIGVVFISLPANLSALSRETGVSIGQLIEAQWPWLWRFGIVLTAAWAMAIAWIPSSIGELMAAGTVVSAVYAVFMLRLILRPPLGLYIHPRVTAMLRRFPPLIGRAVAS
jgi:O-antigen/teichoic acid export membrane protein